jgi:hypothetical protein
MNLLATGHYFDVAVRDVAMAIAAFTPARLTEAGASTAAREGVEARSLVGQPLQADRLRAIKIDYAARFKTKRSSQYETLEPVGASRFDARI